MSRAMAIGHSILKILTLKCREAAELTSASMDGDLLQFPSGHRKERDPLAVGREEGGLGALGPRNKLYIVLVNGADIKLAYIGRGIHNA